MKAEISNLQKEVQSRNSEMDLVRAENKSLAAATKSTATFKQLLKGLKNELEL